MPSTQPYVNYLRGVSYRHKDIEKDSGYNKSEKSETPTLDISEWTKNMIECKRMKARVHKDFCGSHYGCKGCRYEYGRS